MRAQHTYEVDILWTGNLGTGTTNYRSYSRNHEVKAQSKVVIPGSSDIAFRGDALRYNPEELLLASLSACHMLFFLHLCAEAGVVVTSYRDRPTGTMIENADGSGQFASVVLRPEVSVQSDDMMVHAQSLHHEAHRYCFIARSVNFPVECQPTIGSE